MPVEMEKIVSLCKRRGFIFPNSEIYGGLTSTWDYGPFGVELKKNVKEAWWRSVVYERDDIEGLDSAILMNPLVWKTSGHVEGFNDPLVECKECKHRFREDDVSSTEEYVSSTEEDVSSRCPECGGELSGARRFNLMFKTFMGSVEDDAYTVYLRPETAQGIFVNFGNVLNTTRRKLPFGVAQIGKAFRNEITPGNFTFRTREFEQMEIEFFVKPGNDREWFEFWKNERLEWYIRYGINKEHLRLREHPKDELAHYALECSDIEYLFPMGWSELEGIANRTDYDLKSHSGATGKELCVFEEATKEKIVPYVIEPSAGVDRSALAFLIDAYFEEEVKGRKRVVLKLHKDLVPIQVAVLPLLRNRESLVEMARSIKKGLEKKFRTAYDDTGSIGKLYRRQDEIGTMYCITVDVQSLDDKAVTVRERDSMNQDRVSVDKLKEYLIDKFL